MINYNKNNKEFLESGVDLARHSFDAFKFDDNIHIVYSLGEDDQVVCIQSTRFIKEHLSEFLWTPFAQFVFFDELDS